MSNFLVKESTMSGIADAVRGLRYEKGTMTPAQIEAKIRASKLGVSVTVNSSVDPNTGKWIRPSEYPNTDVLAAQLGSTDDCVYLTYDLRKTPGYGWIGVYVRNAENNTSYYVERGHIANGAFVVDASYEQSSGASDQITSTRWFRQALDSADGDVQLWRVRSDNQITRFSFGTNSTVNAEMLPTMLQPCVEMTGRLSNLTELTRSGSYISDAGTNFRIVTQWTQRFSVACGGQATVMSGGPFRWAYDMVECDLSGWDTTGWNVTSLSTSWGNCYSLQNLDLSGWDTSDWAVTTLESCWYACYSLKNLDLSGWDTSNWAVTSMNSCWYQCYSLQHIDYTGWDTSNWAVTNLNHCWRHCLSLQSLDLSGWDTTDWAVTSMYSCWDGCHRLQNLNLNNWDTENWAVTRIDSCWLNCYTLQSLDLSGWDTSNWAVTNMGSCWSGCFSMKSFNLTGWDTTGWNIGFQLCFWFMSLETLDVTPFSGATITLFDRAFGDPASKSIRTIIGWSKLDCSNATKAFVPNLESLENYDGANISVDHSYNNALKLTRQSLLNILNTLPTVSEARTITLGATNKAKLTDTEIAIATNKGWTVA